MTSAESSVSEPPNLKNFLGRIPPDPPYKAPKAPAFGTRNNAPFPPSPPRYKRPSYGTACTGEVGRRLCALKKDSS